MESVTCTVIGKLPEAVGVPARTPDALKVTPAGKVPAVRDQAYGVVPPVAANVAL